MAYTVNNVNTSVPDAVRDLFFGYLPFGSDYVMFCSENSNSRVVYECLYRRVGQKTLSRVTCSRASAQSEWVLSENSLSTEYSGFSVSKPYYSYSNVEGQGRYSVSPTGQNMSFLLLAVIASLLVLKFVFGGISLWSRKSDPY